MSKYVPFFILFFILFSILSPIKTEAATAILFDGTYSDRSPITIPQRQDEVVTVTINATADFYHYFINGSNTTKYSSATSSFQIPANLLSQQNDTLHLHTTNKSKNTEVWINNYRVTVTQTYTEDLDAPIINLSFSTTELTGKDVGVTYSLTETSALSKILLAIGDQPISYFESNGVNLGNAKNGIFQITKNDTYTFYAEDSFGNKSRKVFQISNIEKSPPSLSAVDSLNNLPENTAIINVEASDNNGISVLKWAKGTQMEGYFTSSGYTISNNSFSVTDNGTYTIYAKDAIDNTKLVYITIDRLAGDPYALKVDKQKYFANQTIRVSFPEPEIGYDFSVEKIRISLKNLSGQTLISEEFYKFSGTTEAFFTVQSVWNGDAYIERSVYNSSTYKYSLLDKTSTFQIITGLTTDKSTYTENDTINVFWDNFGASEYYLELFDSNNNIVETFTVFDTTAQITNIPAGTYSFTLNYFDPRGDGHSIESPLFSISEVVDSYENIFRQFGSIDFGSVSYTPGTNKKISATTTELNVLEFIQGNPTKSKYQITMQLTPFTSPSGNSLSANNFVIKNAERTTGANTTNVGPFSFTDNSPTVLLDLSSDSSPYTEINKLTISPSDVELTIPSDFVTSQTEDFTSTITYSVSLIP